MSTKTLKAVPAQKTSNRDPQKGTTRQEIDALTQKLGQHIIKNPKKASKIFETWLNAPAKSDSKKKAA